MSGNSAKARALGSLLRTEREKREPSLRKFADRLGRAPSVVSRWETGKLVPDPTDVAQMLTLLGVNGERYDEILAMAHGTGEPVWLAVTLPEQRRHLAALLEFERTATVITAVSPLLIPGLTQTSGYVRAIMSAGSVPPSEVETRVAVRLGRRDALERRDPVTFVALIGEAALRQRIGGAPVMTEQLRQLLRVADRPNVTMQIIPLAADWHPALEGPFTLIDSDQGPVVHIENRRSGMFLHEDEDVDLYRDAARMIMAVAMSPADSSGLIAEVLQEMETEE